MVEIKQKQDLSEVLGITLTKGGAGIVAADIKTLADGSKNMDRVFEKIILANSINDSAHLDFYEVKNAPAAEPEIITPICADNVIIFGLTLQTRINKATKACKDVGSYNSEIKRLLSPFKNIKPNKIKATNYSPAKDLTGQHVQAYLDTTLLLDDERENLVLINNILKYHAQT